MPWYRVQFVPEKIQYRNGTVLLETARDREDWVWRALNDAGSSVVLLRRESLVAFARDRFEGFEVEPGSASDKIMAKLVRDGSAELTRPGAVHVRSARDR